MPEIVQLFRVREYDSAYAGGGKRQLYATAYDFTFVLFNGRLMFVPTVGLS